MTQERIVSGLQVQIEAIALNACDCGLPSAIDNYRFA